MPAVTVVKRGEGWCVRLRPAPILAQLECSALNGHILKGTRPRIQIMLVREQAARLRAWHDVELVLKNMPVLGCDNDLPNVGHSLSAFVIFFSMQHRERLRIGDYYPRWGTIGNSTGNCPMVPNACYRTARTM